MTPPSKKPGQFNWQTILIGGGASLVVFLTILAAFFLANNDLAVSDPTPTLLAATPTPTDVASTATATQPSDIGITPILQTPAASTASPTSVLAATATSTDPIATPLPTLSPTPTFTLVPTGTRPPQPTPTPCFPPSNWVVYIVQPGDTLFSLAAKTGITADFLRAANCLPNNDIYVGQRLYLPYMPPTNTPPVTPTFTSSPTPTLTGTPTSTPTVETPTPTSTATATPIVDTPTPTETPFVSLGTPTPTIVPTIPVVLPTDTPSGG